MSDSQTIKLGGYFVMGIGSIVFLLGLGAYIFYLPGGQLRDLPDTRCKCRWNTLWPALAPLLITILNVLSRFNKSATFPATNIRWPNVSLSSSKPSESFGITFFGIINRWVGACGCISFITIESSSS